MPQFYKSGEYDIAGFCVGVVEKRKIIDGSKIRPGNLVIGLASSGVHSNGFSLVRKVFSRNELRSLSKELLEPTRIYVKPVLSLLRSSVSACRQARLGLRSSVKGIAHITGGAFYDKIGRILPRGLEIRIYRGSWPVPKIFHLLQDKGNIADREMYHTFNMGIGMVLIVEPKSARVIISKLSKLRIKSYVIGQAVRGDQRVRII
jgi:phosphoribosylformylglycinamidine cyclo-ligase